MESNRKIKILDPVKKSLTNESGIALISAMVILAVLSMLGAGAILTSETDLDIARNEKIGLQATYAAEAGLSMAIAELNVATGPDGKIEDADGVTEGDDDTWSVNIPTANVGLTADDNTSPFFDVAVTVAYKRDSGACPGQVAFYNQNCGFADSPYVTGGSPVYVLTSVATRDDFSSTLKVELTKQVLDINVEGGLTANGAINTTGNITIDGTAHDQNGNAGGVCNDADLSGNQTGIYSDVSVTAGGSTNIAGTPPTQVGTTTAPSTPWGAMGVTESQFNDLFNAPVASRAADGTLSGYTWVQGNFGTSGAASGNDIGGSGILVVHNPNFETDKWEKWNNDARYKAAGCVGVDAADVAWCAAYDADESAYQPARMGNITGGTFKGLVVADWIDSIQGNTKIIGSVVSFTTIEVSAIGAGTAEILFSCEALEAFAGGRTNFKLNWQRVY